MGQFEYRMNQEGEFIIENYNYARPFSSFLPGIAGADGIPLWVFYVNRAQCVCSFGVRDKDNAILEFHPANRAYRNVSTEGFRTFLRIDDNSRTVYHEPFQAASSPGPARIEQRMIVRSESLALEEVNQDLNLEFSVEYFPVPEDDYGGLVRLLQIENIGKRPVSLSGLDGLPTIVPHGVDNHCLKNMRRTIEAFVEVCNLSDRVPYFKAKLEPADRPGVQLISRGNFYLGFESTDSGMGLVQPLVDSERVFGVQTDLRFPRNFLELSSTEALKDQRTEGILPCAFGSFERSLRPGERFTYTSVVGHVASLDRLTTLVPRIVSNEYVDSRRQLNRAVVSELTQNNLVCSSQPSLDHYARQNFLDNVMRGGFPVTFNGLESRTTLHIYSRKHGDLERDYNDFRLLPTKYSQGNGNFRDINQNRRSDLFFNPDVEESNVRYFYNLIQTDGFNPLVLKEVKFLLQELSSLPGVLENHIPDEPRDHVSKYLTRPFTPGGLLEYLDLSGISLNSSSKSFLSELLEISKKLPESEHGEGYWVDHWTYNLDLLENFLAVYPDKFKQLLFDDISFTFHNSPYSVQSRDEKYVLNQGQPMQLNAVRFDEKKSALINDNGMLVRTEFGEGSVYSTSLFAKLLCLIANKVASLDPQGVGVEMEAGKPGWYDALNGLPGLFGSSVSETLELKRHIQFLLEQMQFLGSGTERVTLFSELGEFLEQLFELLKGNYSVFEFWDKASDAKESFRELTRFGISGSEIDLTINWIRDFLEAALKKLDGGLEKAIDSESNTIFTYFRQEVIRYDVIRKSTTEEGEEIVHIKPLEFNLTPLPLFLEGPVHYLRCKPSPEAARVFVGNVRRSALFDRKLGMYKVNAPLGNEPLEIGRSRVFTPGWLENESIWLHMEYKYLLEMLRSGLYAEFFEDFKNACVPFLKPEVYGRSTLENSSFIVSSAHPDQSIHGTGFIARLSGATAEFISILMLMALGSGPFRLSAEGELQFSLKPVLPAWLFTDKPDSVKVKRGEEWTEERCASSSFSFMFLGSVLVSYSNPEMKDTFGDAAVKPSKWKLIYASGEVRTLDGEELTGDVAYEIRERKVSRIDVELA